MQAHPLRAILVLALTLAPFRAVGAEEIDFNRDIRPILARHCFKCHGPDDKARKAKLRLDTRAGALGEAKTGMHVIAPGKPQASELMRRISTSEKADVMPPPATKNPLTEAQKELLRRWIAAGAEYRPHWAFVAPRQAALPKVRQADWPANAIDYFVLARLEAQGLQPSPRAERHALARRLYLDLIGLPPTPEEADAFVHDPSPDAYERLVDRLLASPHYGERWARRWLDLARYADTNGYEKDRQRSIWPYRDWVIGAINRDLPFDQFTIEQLAGDMLPGATVQQKVATGFHRNTMLNEEGGIDPLEYRYYAVVDRINTTATVWLGLTLGCAQCHTHKFDPIAHREYYQMMAFLNNADEPEMEVPRPELTTRRGELRKQIATLEKDLPNRVAVPDRDDDKRPIEARRREQLARKFEEWCQRESARAVHWTVLRPADLKSNVAHLRVLDDGSVLASGDQSKQDIYDLNFHGVPRDVTAIRLEVLPHDSLPKGGPGRIFYEGPFGDFFLSELTLAADGRPIRLRHASQSFGTPAAAAIDGDPATGWSINGGQGRAHAAVFNLDQRLGGPKDLSVRLLFERYYAAGLGRFRLSVTRDPGEATRGVWGSRRTERSLSGPVRTRGLPADVEELLLTAERQRSPAQQERLLHYYLSVAPELATARAGIKKLRDQLPALPTTLVIAERPADDPRPTHVHRRGEFLQAEERVEPGVLSVLPGLPEGAPRNRLTFARWLVDASNPLVGRVTMNRQWAAFFGQGIVRTTQDFGFQGEPPTHPELLDWLAVELVRQGWSMKQMHRLIVTSATYQQTAQASPELLERDPANQLLARGPRWRLEAELIRDSALRSSGLLSTRLGGPSVFPPQPAGVASEGTYGALAWKPSEGPERYRRGVYTFSKRTAPFAMAVTFDAPSGEACLARREVSNTPLQALTLLNDPVFVEAAQALGRRLADEAGPVEDRITALFRRCLSRPPTEEERKLLMTFYLTQKERLVKKELNAVAIAGAGDGDVGERAAWTLLARAVLNLDEAIVK